MPRRTAPRLVAVGASAGGLFALREIAAGLPAGFGAALAVVQHRSRESAHLCDLLQDCCPLPVTEVVDKMDVVPGTVFVAPPDYHLLVEEGGSAFSLSTDDPVRFSRPSIDVFFRSVADTLGAAGMGVVLTGANADGAEGLRAIVDAGGHGVVQSPATAEVAVMPRAAMAAVPEAAVLPLDAIAAHLSRLVPARAGGRP